MATEEASRTTPEELKAKLDSADHLKGYGFGASNCMKCGVSNSEIDGLLMQCGMCKKVGTVERTLSSDD